MLTLMSMGVTSENVAEKFGIGRDKQDQMALESHLKAAKAQKDGLFKGTKHFRQIKQYQLKQRSKIRTEMKLKLFALKMMELEEIPKQKVWVS